MFECEENPEGLGLAFIEHGLWKLFTALNDEYVRSIRIEPTMWKELDVSSLNNDK